MIERLTPAELGRMRSASRNPEYVEFMQDLRVGQGGRVVVADTGVSRQSVKNRVNEAATVEREHLYTAVDALEFRAHDAEKRLRKLDGLAPGEIGE